jgi:Transposase DDE domain group 1
VLAFCDNTGEFLAATLRPGNACSNTAADHIAVLDQALAQNPDAHWHGRPILVRADGAGGSKAFLAHIRSLRQHGTATQFSVGWAITAREPAAIGLLRERDWTPAVDPDGEPCPVIEAAVAELGNGTQTIGVTLTHAGSPAAVTVTVSDSSPQGPTRRDTLPGSEQGRGLQIVEALSAHWGWRQESGGKAVFAVLAREA